MPAELGRLTSLQMLTCFVAGADPSCSNVRELQNLDLGGKLELRQLENVTGADAQAACLGNKEKLTELVLGWTNSNQVAQNNLEEVVEGLKPHDGLKLLMIYSCGSRTFPKWMNTLKGIVELHLQCCKKLEKLPALWELPALKILSLQTLENLHCLCSRGTTPIIFSELKVLNLYEMPNFEAWWDTNEDVQGDVPIFPKLEKLQIRRCGSLTALPKAVSVIMESSGGVDMKCRSTFPALTKMWLSDLTMFGKWETVKGTLEKEVMFPRLEEMYISSCGSLSALPKGSLLVEQSFDGAKTVCCRSAFPALKKLHLSGLSALERWGAIEGTPGEQVTYPLLEDLIIRGCPKLTDLPEALKLSALSIQGDDPQISLQAASRYIPSLSSLTLDASPNGRWSDPHVRTSIRKVPLPAIQLNRCNLLFSSHPSALALWTCFAQLVDLEIWYCDALDYWPQNVFHVLVCLRNLLIFKCSKLTGRTQQASHEQSAAPAPECGGLLPSCLESLNISYCESLIEVPDLPGSLKTLIIGCCSDNDRSIVFGRQDDTRLVGGEGVVRPDMSSLILGYNNSDAEASTAVLNLSSTANHRFLPCLESLNVWSCYGLTEVTNLPPSIKNLSIQGCKNLQSLSGQLDAVQKLSIRSCSGLKSLHSGLGDLRSLEELELYDCKSLVSLPDGPQAYSSLKVLKIKSCDGIKLIPPSLQSRLCYLKKKDLDAHLEAGPDLAEPNTRKCAIRSLVCLK